MNEPSKASAKISVFKPGYFCLLCGSKPDVGAVFVPDDPLSFGGAEGKTRIVTYSLCQACFDSPDMADRIEKVLKFELGGKFYAEQ